MTLEPFEISSSIMKFYGSKIWSNARMSSKMAMAAIRCTAAHG